MIQPAGLVDVNQGGVTQLSERLVVFVPVGIERRLTGDEPVTLRRRSILLRGAPVVFPTFGGLVAGDANPLAAAFDDRGGDRVEVGINVFVVVRSELWAGSHARAELLRET